MRLHGDDGGESDAPQDGFWNDLPVRDSEVMDGDEEELEGDAAPDGEDANLPELDPTGEEREVAAAKHEEVPSYVAELRGDSPLLALKRLRWLLSYRGRPIEQMLRLGAVPLLVGLMRGSESNETRNQAAWALANIAAGTKEHARAVVEASALPVLVSAIRTTSDRVMREQAVWCLANIGFGDPDLRDAVLAAGAMEACAHVLGASNGAEQLAAASRIRPDVCRLVRTLFRPNHYPPAPLRLLTPALSLMGGVLGGRSHSDSDVSSEPLLSEAMSAVRNLVDLREVEGGESARIQAALDAGLGAAATEFAQHAAESVHHPAVAVIGQILSASEQQADYMLAQGCIHVLELHLESANEEVRKDALFALSNLTAGSYEQVKRVMESGVLEKVLACMGGDSVDFVRHEATFAACNVVLCHASFLDYMLQHRFLRRLCKQLANRRAEPALADVMLNALDIVLKAGKDALEPSDR